ncbi:UNVERIFIED_CONTAM: Pentatricopeptide repeat-containing protein [Sesamum angustifolium]|uniref:Pentatricopeptide repeat-containing protein n=1 Tax=Sesamum angustifolium TaxID=2727405 RepID=A0AAW2LJN0_9LAMI
MPVRNDVSWAVMISGFVSCGSYTDALRYFNDMSCELKPNEAVLVCALSACAKLGSLDQGNWIHQGSSIFYNMEILWGIVPKIEHYGCYVDLLGRAGYLAKAFGIVKTMPLNPDIVVWRALLSACRIHRDADFGERIINHLEQLDPHSCAGADVLLSNLYASLGKWEKVALLRKTMDKQKNQSDIGCSWIEVNGVVHEFRVADLLHR